jgi:hypothetical protein
MTRRSKGTLAIVVEAGTQPSPVEKWCALKLSVHMSLVGTSEFLYVQ